MSASGTDFCVNVRIMNKSSIVKGQVRELLGNHKLGRAAGKIANEFVSVEEVADKIGETMANNMPKELGRQGIGVTCRLRFRHGPLIVLCVRVVRIDFARLASRGAAPGVLARLAVCFEFLPSSWRRRMHAVVLRRVTEELIAKVADEATRDLSASGVCADVTSLSLAEEAEFLFDAIEAIDKGSDARNSSMPPLVLQRAALELSGQESRDSTGHVRRRARCLSTGSSPPQAGVCDDLIEAA